MLEQVLNNNITQVGYEIELDSQHYSDKDIAKNLGLNFSEFLFIKGHKIGIKMSKEYYASTIEFNFAKEEFNINLHAKVKKFTEEVMKKYSLKVYGNRPAFVGTHIHFFRSGLNTKSPDAILKIVLQFLSENLDDLHINSVERIVCSHQLWGNYACTMPEIAILLKEELGMTFAYADNSKNRPKYRPVIHSPRSSTGKLRSTEIRLIPTELVLNDKVLILIERLRVFEPISNESIPSLYNKLIQHYKGLLKKQKSEEQ